MASYEYMISLMYHDKILSSSARGGSQAPGRQALTAPPTINAAAAQSVE
jgi:hypothetical protein